MPSETTVNRSDLTQANAAMAYTVEPSDLPLSCPMPGMTLWDSHPRVYLEIEKTGTATCPYCGADFTLERD
jgi:uncharacterized Zn-finger protein